jgi:hypothetical protein
MRAPVKHRQAFEVERMPAEVLGACRRSFLALGREIVDESQGYVVAIAVSFRLACGELPRGHAFARAP